MSYRQEQRWEFGQDNDPHPQLVSYQQRWVIKRPVLFGVHLGICVGGLIQMVLILAGLWTPPNVAMILVAAGLQFAFGGVVAIVYCPEQRTVRVQNGNKGTAPAALKDQLKKSLLED